MLRMNESELLPKELKKNAGSKTEERKKGMEGHIEPSAATPERGKRGGEELTSRGGQAVSLVA